MQHCPDLYPKHWLKAIALLLFSSLFIQAHPQTHLQQVNSLETFKRLAGDPISDKYGQVSSLKLLMALRDSAVYYISSEAYEYHFDFCRKELGYWKEHGTFNVQNYSQDPSREYCLATINHYAGGNVWSLEFSSADDFPPQLIAPFYKRVSETFFRGDSLRLLLNTLLLERKWASMKPVPCPSVDVNAIYAGQLMQPLHKASAYGYFRIASAREIQAEPPGIHDIVLLTEDLLDIPPIAGLLSLKFQTPLSHLVLLSKNRGTPFLAQRDLLDDPRIQASKGQLVYFSVVQDSFILRPATLAEATLAWAKQQPKSISLKQNITRKGLLPMSALNAKSVDVVGGKAANFAELSKLAKASKGKWKVPEGAFAIPFYYYAQHMQRSGAQNLLECLLRDPASRANTESLRECLGELRARIRMHPVDTELLSQIDSLVRATSPSTRMRFRSSTNAEDIEGFNGAGLYESRTGELGNQKQSVAEAITKVWASLWSFEAFQEREYFGIDHHKVAMGLLVHRSFPDEMANGVAITKNLYREGYFGFVINVQIGETSVVSPPPGVTCEQLICYQDTEIDFFKKKRIIEYITRSSLTRGEPVLTEAQVLALTEALAKLKEHYYWKVKGSARKVEYRDFALDVEFKFDKPNGQLYLKQVRPFND